MDPSQYHWYRSAGATSYGSILTALLLCLIAGVEIIRQILLDLLPLLLLPGLLPAGQSHRSHDRRRHL